MPIRKKKAVAAGISRIGKDRAKNDDRFLVTDLGESTLLFAVSDGLGGNPDGDIAAEDIMRCLGALETGSIVTPVPLSDAINQADMIIRNKVENNSKLEGMGATVTAAIIGQERVCWAHVGDSRMYLVRNGILRQITRDHTFLQDLIDWGDVSVEAALTHPMRHVLDQCVGGMDSGIDSGEFEILADDILILCTDGLHSVVTEEEMVEIVLSTEQLSHCTAKLLDASLQGGSLDDITIVVAHIT